MQKSKLTIAVDIDDVLAANAENFVKFSNDRWGTRLKPDDYTEHWAQMWGISHEEAQERREEILSEKLFVKHPFFGEAKPVLVELAKNYKLVVVSSRGRRVQADTMDWINQNFKGIFEGIHFAKIWDEPDIHIEAKIKMTKTEICKEVDADYLIDDQPKHCLAVADAGITALLFGEYAWTDVPNLPKNVVRAKNWQEVLEYFDARTGL